MGMPELQEGDLFRAAAAVAVACLVPILLYLLERFVGPKPALDPHNFIPFTLIKKESLSHDTRRFTFAFKGPKIKLGLPIGQHIALRCTETLADGTVKRHQRSYTPTTGNETPGRVEFVIKVYKANVHPKFPAGGKLSQYLDALKLGETVDMKGPKGHMSYGKRGAFTLAPLRKSEPLQRRTAKHFGMIAGGTGITPMLQVLHAVLRDEPDSPVTASLLYANQTEDDILVRAELEGLAARFPKRFKFHYTVDTAPEGWGYSTGFITKEMIQEHLPKAKGDGSTQVLVCGPPPMVKFACLPHLEALGFRKEDYFVF